MQRDMDLVREILKIVEEHARPQTWGKVNVDGRESAEVNYHIKLLADAGYLTARPNHTSARYSWEVNGLTWEGHEFLDTIWNDAVWSRVKSAIVSKGGSASIEVVKELAVQISKQLHSRSLKVSDYRRQSTPASRDRGTVNDESGRYSTAVAETPPPEHARDLPRDHVQMLPTDPEWADPNGRRGNEGRRAGGRRPAL